MWGKVSCLRKQHDGRGWASNNRPAKLSLKKFSNDKRYSEFNKKINPFLVVGYEVFISTLHVTFYITHFITFWLFIS